MTTNHPETPNNQLETALGRLAELTFQSLHSHDEALTRLEGNIERLEVVVTALATQQQQQLQQTAIDRQAWQTEIQRIWQYLERQTGNGRGGEPSA